MKAIRITTENEFEIMNVEKNGQALYDKIRDVVGGHFENVYPKGLPDGYVMEVNEEGRLARLPENEIASMLYGNRLEYIAGDVMILKLGEYEGEPDVVGMTEDEAWEIAKTVMTEYGKRQLIIDN